MSVTNTFTDARGNVYIDGREEPRLRVVGWLHALGCQVLHAAGSVEIGRDICDCAGKVVMGWRDGWPLLPTVPGEAIIIDYSEDA